MAAQQPLKGLQLDTRPLEQPEGSYPHGKNGIQHDLKGAVRNEEGFTKMAAMAPYTINGIIETSDFPVIFSTDNTHSAIGYFNSEEDVYIPIEDDRGKPYQLGFSTSRWITGQSQKNYKGETVIAFTDKDKNPKFLNCDKPAITTLDDYSLFPVYKEPRLETSIQSGGRLLQGSYYVSGKYQKEDGTETGFTPVSRALVVSGDGTDLPTGKAILITASGLDESYQYIVFAIISKIKGITKTVELDPMPIKADRIVISFTGDNLTTDIALEEVTTPRARYSKVQAIGQLNDAVYLAGLEAEPEILDMQPFANQVKVEWVSELYDAISPPQELYNGEKKGLMHEEIYALYIRYRLTKGGATVAFHLPGEAPTPAQRLDSTIGAIGHVKAPSFRVDDLIPSYDAATKTGKPGPWENEEEYPAEGFGDLNGLKVRHHKMPSIAWCKTNLYHQETEYGKTKLDILGIRATNIVIPPKYAGVISGYEIFYAKRTIGNMTVMGQGQLLYGAVTEGEKNKSTGTVDIFSSGGNWDADTYQKAKNDTPNNQELRLRKNTFRFHAFDMLLNKPAFKADYISCQLFCRKNNLRSGYMLDGGKTGDTQIVYPTVHIVDYTLTSQMSAPTTSTKLLKVNDSFYASNGINAGRFINIRHESAYVGTLASASWPLASVVQPYYLPGRYPRFNELKPSSDPHIFEMFVALSPNVEETYLVNMKTLKSSPYFGLLVQELVSMGEMKDLTDSSPIFGGDVFISDYSFHTYGRHNGLDYLGDTPVYGGKKVVRRFVCETVSNVHLRYELPGNEHSKWFPKTAIPRNDVNKQYLAFWDRNIEPNQFGYNRDLNALNDINDVTIFSPHKEYLTQFPFRIQRGGKLSRQSKTRSWRTFLPLDYYEMQKNMGKPIHLEGMDDTLLIHCENALFRTQDKAKLEGGLLSVTLGAGDIFQFEPQEALSAKLGYAGSQHDLACVRTPAGYIFPDAQTGELFLFKGELQPINLGVTRFFRDYLNVPEVNVFDGNGITIGWDPKYKRILLTVKNRRISVGAFKNFSDTPAFWDNLKVGDIVLYKNRYILYEGKDADVITWKASSPSCLIAPGCAAGYSLNPTGTACIKEESIAATPGSGGSGTAGTAAPISDPVWNMFGGRLFAPGYPISGDGVRAVDIIDAYVWKSNMDITRSRMNIAGIWSSTPTPAYEKIGFARKIFTPVAKTVFVGMAADNAFTFRLNGEVLVSVETGMLENNPNFNYWNMYPVQLLAGDNYIEMLGWNFSDQAGFAAEIYDCTQAQLVAVTTESELEPYIIFSTRDIIGENFDLGHTQGWSCPVGWSLRIEGDVHTCVRMVSGTVLQVNTGLKEFGTRDRYRNEVYDGVSEPNDDAGDGPYFPPVEDIDACPL